MSVSDDEIRAAVDVLRRGGLVAFPTETVYGLGADAANPAALRRLFAAKGRPADHPVIVHVAGVEHLADWAATVPEPARRLVERFWPGPLTVLVPRSARVPDEVTGGRDTVGVRAPDQPVALALLRAFGGGVAAPSANRFGRVSPTTAADVRADLGGVVDVVLDGGPCRVGVESTIVDCTAEPPVIVRRGGVTEAMVAAVLGHPVGVVDTGAIAAPGTHRAHYAPRARVHLVTAADAPATAAALRGAGRRVGLLAPAGVVEAVAGALVEAGAPAGGAAADLRILPPPADVDEYARVLYARLRDADACRLDDLVAVAPEPEGIGAAVADRLRRAAAGSGTTGTGPEPGQPDEPGEVGT